MRIAETAVAALRKHETLTRFRQIREQRLLVVVNHLRADRNLQHHIRAIRAVPVLAHAVAARPRLEMLLVAVVDQRVESVDRLNDYAAAAPAVAAARSAEFDELLASERDAAVAAVARAHIDLGFVEELHGALDNTWPWRAGGL